MINSSIWNTIFYISADNIATGGTNHMSEKRKNKYKAPRVSDNKKNINPTAAMMADTYDEMLLEEMKETLAATVYAETFPDLLDYEDLAQREK